MSWSRFRSKATAWFKKEKVVLKQSAFDLIRFWGLFHVTTNYGVNITLCIGPSMIPTFKENGDVVLIDNFSYRVMREQYKTGDVIVSVCPYDVEKTVCKRIAGTAGDVVVVNRNKGIYSEPILIPPGHVWLAGDNSWNSTDSRTYGPVPVALLRGRVFWKLKLNLMLGEPISRVAPPPPPPPPPPQRSNNMKPSPVVPLATGRETAAKKRGNSDEKTEAVTSQKTEKTNVEDDSHKCKNESTESNSNSKSDSSSGNSSTTGTPITASSANEESSSPRKNDANVSQDVFVPKILVLKPDRGTKSPYDSTSSEDRDRSY